MIGTINVNGFVAIMNDDGTWKSSHRPLEIILQSLYSVGQTSEADGQFGHRQIGEAAERFGVEPHFVVRGGHSFASGNNSHAPRNHEQQ